MSECWSGSGREASLCTAREKTSTQASRESLKGGWKGGKRGDGKGTRKDGNHKRGKGGNQEKGKGKGKKGKRRNELRDSAEEQWTSGAWEQWSEQSWQSEANSTEWQEADNRSGHGGYTEESSSQASAAAEEFQLAAFGELHLRVLFLTVRKSGTLEPFGKNV